MRRSSEALSPILPSSVHFESSNRVTAGEPLAEVEMEGEYSNGEDAEVEDAGEDVEVEATARNEETRKIPSNFFCYRLMATSPLHDQDSY